MMTIEKRLTNLSPRQRRFLAQRIRSIAAQDEPRATPSSTLHQLVAYVVPAGDDITEISVIMRDYLRARVPEYMVPSTFVLMDKLPVTPNGKVDRDALPDPGVVNVPVSDSYVTPRNSIEKVLASIWADVLEIERVGVHDNFFSIGGHSLMVTVVRSQICEIFQIELPLRVLFEASTIEKLSEKLIEMESTPGQTKKIAKIVISLEDLTDEDAQKLLDG